MNLFNSVIDFHHRKCLKVLRRASFPDYKIEVYKIYSSVSENANALKYFKYISFEVNSNFIINLADEVFFHHRSKF